MIFCLFTAWILTQPIFSGHSITSEPSTLTRIVLRRHVLALSEVLGPRSWEHKENLETIAGYIAAEWRNNGLPDHQQTFITQDGEYKNIFTTLGPDTEEVIVIGAHYDAIGALPGADDNASGVATVIELAKALKSAELKTRVIVIAYALEEPPHFRTEEMGSVAHARAMKQLGKKVKAMIAVEMVGYFSDQPGSQRFPFAPMKLLYPSTGNFLAVAGDLGTLGLTRRVKRSMASASKLPIRSINAPRALAGIDFSDHQSYRAEGFPAVMLTDTAFYRNPHYHTAGDRPEHLDYRRMALGLQSLAAAVKDLANE